MMENDEMFALLLVTYPAYNHGAPCREFVDKFHNFDKMVEFTDHWMGKTIAADRCEKDDTQFPGWDYLEMEDK